MRKVLPSPAEETKAIRVMACSEQGLSAQAMSEEGAEPLGDY